MEIIKRLLIGIFLLGNLGLTAQDFKNEKQLTKGADDAFKDGKYEEALPLYSTLISNYPKDPNYNYRYGACLLFTGSDKEKPIKYLQYAASKPEVDPAANYYYGLVLHLNYEFAQANKYYKKYKAAGKSSEIKTEDIDNLIKQCDNGQTLLKTITDLIVLDKKQLQSEDFYKVYDLTEFGGQILVKPESFQTEYDKKVSDKGIFYFPKDAEKIFFGSYSTDNKTGKDIYYAVRNEDRSWSEPISLGEPINTPYDEDYPFMHPSGTTLYFASKGHNSLGGYDIFVSRLDTNSGKWSEPQNMDFAINTPADDYLFITDNAGESAYFSSDRESPLGEVSVYQINLDRVPLDFAFVYGTFNSENTKKANIKVQNAETMAIVGEYSTDENGKYKIKLPNDGKFNFIVDYENSTITHSGVVELNEQNAFKPLKQEMLVMEQGTESEKLVIKNLIDEEVKDAASPITADFLKEKAKLEINKDRYKDRKKNKEPEVVAVANVDSINAASDEDLSAEHLGKAGTHIGNEKVIQTPTATEGPSLTVAENIPAAGSTGATAAGAAVVGTAAGAAIASSSNSNEIGGTEQQGSSDPGEPEEMDSLSIEIPESVNSNDEVLLIANNNVKALRNDAAIYTAQSESASQLAISKNAQADRMRMEAGEIMSQIDKSQPSVELLPEYQDAQKKFYAADLLDAESKKAEEMKSFFAQSAQTTNDAAEAAELEVKKIEGNPDADPSASLASLNSIVSNAQSKTQSNVDVTKEKSDLEQALETEKVQAMNARSKALAMEEEIKELKDDIYNKEKELESAKGKRKGELSEEIERDKRDLEQESVSVKDAVSIALKEEKELASIQSQLNVLNEIQYIAATSDAVKNIEGPSTIKMADPKDTKPTTSALDLATASQTENPAQSLTKPKPVVELAQNSEAGSSQGGEGEGQMSSESLENQNVNEEDRPNSTEEEQLASTSNDASSSSSKANQGGESGNIGSNDGTQAGNVAGTAGSASSGAASSVAGAASASQGAKKSGVVAGVGAAGAGVAAGVGAASLASNNGESNAGTGSSQNGAEQGQSSLAQNGEPSNQVATGQVSGGSLSGIITEVPEVNVIETLEMDKDSSEMTETEMALVPNKTAPASGFHPEGSLNHLADGNQDVASIQKYGYSQEYLDEFFEIAETEDEYEKAVKTYILNEAWAVDIQKEIEYLESVSESIPEENQAALYNRMSSLGQLKDIKLKNLEQSRDNVLELSQSQNRKPEDIANAYRADLNTRLNLPKEEGGLASSEDLDYTASDNSSRQLSEEEVNQHLATSEEKRMAADERAQNATSNEEEMLAANSSEGQSSSDNVNQQNATNSSKNSSSTSSEGLNESPGTTAGSTGVSVPASSGNSTGVSAAGAGLAGGVASSSVGQNQEGVSGAEGTSSGQGNGVNSTSTNAQAGSEMASSVNNESGQNEGSAQTASNSDGATSGADRNSTNGSNAGVGSGNSAAGVVGGVAVAGGSVNTGGSNSGGSAGSTAQDGAGNTTRYLSNGTTASLVAVDQGADTYSRYEVPEKTAEQVMEEHSLDAEKGIEYASAQVVEVQESLAAKESELASSKRKERAIKAAEVEQVKQELELKEKQQELAKYRSESLARAADVILVSEPGEERESEKEAKRAERLKYEAEDMKLSLEEKEQIEVKGKKKKRIYEAEVSTLRKDVNKLELEASSSALLAQEMAQMEEDVLFAYKNTPEKLPPSDKQLSQADVETIQGSPEFSEYDRLRQASVKEYRQAEVLNSDADEIIAEMAVENVKVMEMKHQASIQIDFEKGQLMMDSANVYAEEVKMKELVADSLRAEAKKHNSEGNHLINQAIRKLKALPSDKGDGLMAYALMLDNAGTYAVGAEGDSGTAGGTVPIQEPLLAQDSQGNAPKEGYSPNEFSNIVKGIDEYPVELEDAIFQMIEFNKSLYDSSNPIPVDSKMPSGVVYKVQIGAFRNPPPPDVFKGFAPVRGETTRPGWMRYTAGLFNKVDQARLKRNEIRALGYQDAFVVAYRNGERISLEEAASLGGSTGSAVTSNTSSPTNNAGGRAGAITSGSSTSEPSSGVAEIKKVEEIQGLLYTVQVGAYNAPINAAQVYDISPLVEYQQNGMYKYGSGVYNDIGKANESKSKIVGLGYADAFVTAFYNGKRVSMAEANTIAQQGSNVFAPEAPSNVPANSATSNSSIVFRVQVGAYREEVPVEDAKIILSLSNLGLDIGENGDMTTYTVGNYPSYEVASEFKDKVVNQGLKGAFVVALNNGQKIDLQRAIQLSKQ